MAQVVQILLGKEKDFSIMLIQYHGCWCPGDARIRGIGNHGIHQGVQGPLLLTSFNFSPCMDK